MFGPQVSFGKLLDQMRMKSVSDFNNYLERLKQFPRYVDQGRGERKVYSFEFWFQ